MTRSTDDAELDVAYAVADTMPPVRFREAFVGTFRWVLAELGVPVRNVL